MDERRTGSDATAPQADATDGTSVARHLAVEHQKEELRRERDRVLVSLAADGGADGLARSMGLSAEVAGRLLVGARERLGAGGPPAVGAQPEIAARRLRERARVTPLGRRGGGGGAADTPARRRTGRISGARPQQPAEQDTKRHEGERWALVDEHFAALGKNLP
jgi:hypothetical protein